MQNPRADLYHALAELLAEPPTWLIYPGKEWPLFAAVMQLAPFSETAREAAEALVEIGAESLAMRRARYAALFVGAGRPQFWLYESLVRSGRLFGPETIAVERVYQSTGIVIASTELPDHAAVELAFLAYLTERQSREPDQSRLWQKLERRFIAQHAGRWLPDLGRALAASGDEVYAPVGKLLANWLEENGNPPRQTQGYLPNVPALHQPDDCTLCGFCVRVCPTRALVIQETVNETRLLLSIPACVGCGKCERICEFKALEMIALHQPNSGLTPHNSADGWQVLRQSRRVLCSRCGQPTVSQAEFEFVAAKIGPQDWLKYCLVCR